MIDDDAAMKEFGKLLGIMRRLRAPGGCPWDAEQTMSGLRRYILEEAHELVEAIEGSNPRDIAEECGDLLLQVVFTAQIASETGAFGIKDVCRVICDKLIKRHPHVFGDVSVRDAGEVGRNWEIIKSGERRARGADGSAMAGIPKGLPALLRALRISERAAKKGFDWRFGDVEAVRAKVLEELDELRAEITGGGAGTIREELGDAFFALANMSRHLGMDPEEALQAANDKFIGRFRTVERLAEDENLRMEEAPLDKLEALWRSAKDIERNGGTEPSGR
ncbi:MAG: nucleoside triphosphate pyrophosphohydrolase [Synergistaceae bacterium]|jgi:XTP/dITP diphosphohydrolase/tetrapyrrole methylase family protein/MazG family protein/ATP diphosphatase|nr:nucleoside triphosphate pyrophosphohydrolase [Synergistaceae bacterium]